MAWNPPAGSEPRAKRELEAVFAAAQGSSQVSGGPEESVNAAKSGQEGSSSAEEPAISVAPNAIEAGQDKSMADREDGELEAKPAQIPVPDEAIEQVRPGFLLPEVIKISLPSGQELPRILMHSWLCPVPSTTCDLQHMECCYGSNARS